MNVILGTAFGYSKDDLSLQVFIKSWKKYCQNEKLYLVVSPNIDKETYNWFLSYGIKLFFFTEAHFIPTSINDTRFYKYIDILLEDNEIDNVFLTDTRDVFFQGNIFDKIDSNGLHVFLEDSRWTCGSQEFNAGIIKTLFGLETLFELFYSEIICSGTILGDKKSILKHLMIMISQRPLDKIISDYNSGVKVSGLDQGIHNFILHKNMISHIKHKNGEGVGTLAILPTSDIAVEETGLISVYGKTPPIIHQWDRHKILCDHLSSLYGDK